MELLYVFLAWFLGNVIGKLLVNSIERIFRDKIDETVKKAPVIISVSFIELIRYCLIVFFVPIMLLEILIPNSIQWNYIQEIRYSKNILFNKKRFHSYFPLLLFAIIHPLAMFSTKRQAELRDLWLRKQIDNTIIIQKNNKHRLPRNSLSRRRDKLQS